MYQATAEAVSGLKVFAGGKWLTCIGNKNVRVGDRIWTDGRCVYGYNQESQSPIVIVSPDIDLAIPIIAMSKNFYTYHKSLIFNDSASKSLNSLTNDKRGNVYICRKKKVLATNTKGGDIYEIIQESKQIFILKNNSKIKQITIPQDAKENAYNECKNICSEQLNHTNWIDKGGSAVAHHYEVISSDGIPIEHAFDWNWYFNNKVTFRSYTELIPIESSPFDHFHENVICEYAFIEDENNWAVILNNSCQVDEPIQFQTELSDALFIVKPYPYLIPKEAVCGPHDYGNMGVGRLCGVSRYTYLIDNQSCQMLFHASIAGVISSNYFDSDTESSWAAFLRPRLRLPSCKSKHIYTTTNITYDTTKLIGKTFPMQDGFSFVINSVVDAVPKLTPYRLDLYPQYTECPTHIEISIYTPNNQKIFTGIFFFIPYIAACKLTASKFLLSVNYSRSYYSEDTDLQTQPVSSGIYEIEDGVVIPLVSGAVANQCLRPMKHYKNWWNNIQTLE